MGHVVNSLEGYVFLSKKVKEFYGEVITYDHVKDVLDAIIPRDINGNQLISYNIKEKGRNTAVFYPEYENISISIEALNKWLDFNSKDLANYYKEEHVVLVRSYLVLMVLTHEVEHAYQYLIGEGKIEAPCRMLAEGYKTLFDLMKKKEYIIPRPITQVRRAISVISYRKNENLYLLERNAQFDSLGVLADLALNNGHTSISYMFRGMKDTFAISGYEKNKDGCLVNTFVNIYMKDKLSKMTRDYEDIDMIERFRLGLPVDEETRGRILNLK